MRSYLAESSLQIEINTECRKRKPIGVSTSFKKIPCWKVFASTIPNCFLYSHTAVMHFYGFARNLLENILSAKADLFRGSIIPHMNGFQNEWLKVVGIGGNHFEPSIKILSIFGLNMIPLIRSKPATLFLSPRHGQPPTARRRLLPYRPSPLRCSACLLKLKICTYDRASAPSSIPKTEFCHKGHILHVPFECPNAELNKNPILSQVVEKAISRDL